VTGRASGLYKFSNQQSSNVLWKTSGEVVEIVVVAAAAQQQQQ